MYMKGEEGEEGRIRRTLDRRLETRQNEKNIIGYAVSLKGGWPARRATAPFLLSGRGIPTYTRGPTPANFTPVLRITQ